MTDAFERNEDILLHVDVLLREARVNLENLVSDLKNAVNDDVAIAEIEDAISQFERVKDLLEDAYASFSDGYDLLRYN